MAALARVAPIASEPARPLAARAPCPRRSSRFVTRAAGSTPPPPTPDFNSRPTAIPPPDADGFGAAGSGASRSLANPVWPSKCAASGVLTYVLRAVFDG